MWRLLGERERGRESSRDDEVVLRRLASCPKRAARQSQCLKAFCQLINISDFLLPIVPALLPPPRAAAPQGMVGMNSPASPSLSPGHRALFLVIHARQ